jgi:hypothetical protein
MIGTIIKKIAIKTLIISNNNISSSNSNNNNTYILPKKSTLRHLNVTVVIAIATLLILI